MGISGTLEYLSDLLGSSHGHKKMKRKQLQTVELKVRMDCEGCELKVKNTFYNMKGVKKVEIDRKQQKVSVTGYVEPSKVLKRAQSTGKKAEIWPYVPYNLISQPYFSQAYDKRAPPGQVRNVAHLSGQTEILRHDDHYTTIFSDDNPNSCAVM